MMTHKPAIYLHSGRTVWWSVDTIIVILVCGYLVLVPSVGTMLTLARDPSNKHESSAFVGSRRNCRRTFVKNLF